MLLEPFQLAWELGGSAEVTAQLWDLLQLVLLRLTVR